MGQHVDQLAITAIPFLASQPLLLSGFTSLPSSPACEILRASPQCQSEKQDAGEDSSTQKCLHLPELAQHTLIVVMICHETIDKKSIGSLSNLNLKHSNPPCSHADRLFSSFALLVLQLRYFL